MIQAFIEGLIEYQFLQNALVASVAIGIAAGVIGCFIILRGMSLMGDAISHAVLPGVALSYILGVNFFVGAIVFGILASILITYISNHSIVKSDTAIGITFSSFLALGVILIGVANSSTDLFHILFGNVLAVQNTDKWLTLGITVLVVALVILFFRPLLITSFDPMMAKAFGMNVQAYHYLLMLLLTLVSVTAMQSVGTVLVVAMLVTPAATAFLYTKRLSHMLIVSSLIGAVSSVVGLFIGYSFNIAAGSSIVLTAAVIFVIGFFLSPQQRQKHGKKNSLKALATVLLIGVGIQLYHQSTQTTLNQNQLQVVATNAILADMIKQVGQEKVAIHSIVPIGKDPHDHEVLPEDIRQATNADIVFYNGLNLETGGNAWFEKLMNNAEKKPNEDYFAVSEKVEPLYLEGSNNQGKEDPHAWLSVANGMLYVETITEKLSQKDPENQGFYKKNAEEYLQKLKALHEESLQRIAKIPDKQKRIVTSEGSFKYFSKAYQIPSSYIWEINTEEEGTPEQLKTLIDQLRESEVPALFLESNMNPKPMQSVSNETGIPIYSQIFTDSLSEPGTKGDSYYAMMQWNIDQIVQGLSQK